MGRVATLWHALGALPGGGVEPVRRDVGGIGFEHDGRERQVFGQATQLQGPLEGEGATKAEFESQFDEGVGLLQAAVEGMGNAA